MIIYIKRNLWFFSEIMFSTMLMDGNYKQRIVRLAINPLAFPVVAVAPGLPWQWCGIDRSHNYSIQSMCSFGMLAHSASLSFHCFSRLKKRHCWCPAHFLSSPLNFLYVSCATNTCLLCNFSSPGYLFESFLKSFSGWHSLNSFL